MNEKTNTTEATQKIKKLSVLAKMDDLKIPLYQRPYKWTSEHVIKLLEDIFKHVHLDNKIYRIGSLILYEEKKEETTENDSAVLNIVDGQQRLTTLSILLYHLPAPVGETNNLLSKLKYTHPISKDNISHNSRVIDNWLASKFTDLDHKKRFRALILEKCEFVVFTVFSEDEAFQLFDSQNARGKELEPYDLLKAFHLREMEQDTEEERQLAVKQWEKAVDDGVLKTVLGNHLFKIRVWVKNQWKYDFTKADIDEFKGVSLEKEQKYPYEYASRILDGFIANAQQDKFLKNQHIGQTFPFSITMPIINGKRFFEYVAYYVQLTKMFPQDENESFEDDFKKFYRKYALNYRFAWRTGDKKVRNLYDNIILLYRDRFGNYEFELFYKAIYKAVYSIRCNTKAIKLETILNSNERKILQEINDCLDPNKLKAHHFKVYPLERQDNKMAKGVDVIKNWIEKNFNEDGATDSV